MGIVDPINPDPVDPAKPVVSTSTDDNLTATTSDFYKMYALITVFIVGIISTIVGFKRGYSNFVKENSYY